MTGEISKVYATPIRADLLDLNEIGIPKSYDRILADGVDMTGQVVLAGCKGVIPANHLPRVLMRLEEALAPCSKEEAAKHAYMLLNGVAPGYLERVSQVQGEAYLAGLTMAFASIPSSVAQCVFETLLLKLKHPPKPADIKEAGDEAAAGIRAKMRVAKAMKEAIERRAREQEQQAKIESERSAIVAEHGSIDAFLAAIKMKRMPE